MPNLLQTPHFPAFRAALAPSIPKHGIDCPCQRPDRVRRNLVRIATVRGVGVGRTAGTFGSRRHPDAYMRDNLDETARQSR